MAATRMAKVVARHLPYVGRIYRQRDTARERLAQALVRAETLEADRASSVARVEELEAEKEQRNAGIEVLQAEKEEYRSKLTMQLAKEDECRSLVDNVRGMQEELQREIEILKNERRQQLDFIKTLQAERDEFVSRILPASSNGALTANDEDAGFMEIWEKCSPYTMSSFERGLALYRAVRYIAQNGIMGDFVECGVWRGGSSMIAMMTLVQSGVPLRRFYLYDTFEGMTEPCERDIDWRGESAQVLLNGAIDQKKTSHIWAYASIDEVSKNIKEIGYDPSAVTFVKGDVRDTISKNLPGQIALLRLDTDFYESTMEELRLLYPRLVSKGVLIIDDFGHWQGARQAVEEYFSGQERARVPRLFHRIDYTARMLVRHDPSQIESHPRYDYLPPGLEDPKLLDFFPSLVPGDPFSIQWPYLRPHVPHIWRTDSRNVHQWPTGVLSIEEAALLYNNALMFRGKRGLEIGCHFGWSAGHLLAAGLRVDIVDPILSRKDQEASVRESLGNISIEGTYRLWAGYSPSIISGIRKYEEEPWSFVFIDGEHEGENPRWDAEAVADLCADNACVMFHDLKSPFVSRGLRVMKNHGWEVGFYNTMQVMGVAWRGNVRPVTHCADLEMPPLDDAWLREFPNLSVRGG